MEERKEREREIVVALFKRHHSLHGFSLALEQWSNVMRR